MKIEKFQLRGNNSVCTGASQLLRGCAPAQLRGKIGHYMLCSLPLCVITCRVDLHFVSLHVVLTSTLCHYMSC
jgi:hypothetical protein